MKRPKIVCDWGSALDPAGGAHERRSPRRTSRLGRGTTSPYSCPIDAFDRCSWKFVGRSRKRGGALAQDASQRANHGSTVV